jgi:hypothetical protein
MYAKLILLILLITGVFISLQLVNIKQFINSKASIEPIAFTDLSEQNGQKITTSSAVKVRLASPYGPTSPNVLGEDTEVETPSGMLDYFIDALNELRVILSPQSSIFPSPTPTPVPARPFFVPQRADIPVIPTSTPIPPKIPSQAPIISKSPDVSASPTTAALPTGSPASTTGYRLSESEVGLGSAQYKAYTAHPLIVDYTFSSSDPGLKILYVQFKNNLNQESQIYSAAVRLVSNSASQQHSPESTTSAVPSVQEASTSAQP